MTRLFAVGGAHIDRRGQLQAEFIPGASIPGSMREEVGGGAFNALCAASRRGASGAIMSLRGGDIAGDAVARAIARAGFEDHSAVFLDRATPSYTAMLDRNGDVIAALADMNLYDIGFPRQMRRRHVRDLADAADGLIVDANLPADALARLLPTGSRAFAIAISPAKAPRLLGVLPRLEALFCNRREATALAGNESGDVLALVSRLRGLGLARCVVSHGAGPVVAFEAGRVLAYTPPAPRRILDVTGAGDALAGVAALALIDGASLDDAVRAGLAAAMLAVETDAAVPDLSDASFDEALGRVAPPTTIAT